MEEIEKLRVRVEKDPNSRLFLPLAEEYRKSGMLDEAISVILRGLERQPGYTSARVALGRIYIEKDMIDEAKREFEAVVSTIPDNLFAHRKLADIYRESGEHEKAVNEYRIVMQLNPLDEDARMCLREIEESSHGGSEPFPVSEGLAAEAGGEIPEFEGAEPGEVPAGTEGDSGSGFEEFAGSLSGPEEEWAPESNDLIEIPEVLESLELSAEEAAVAPEGQSLPSSGETTFTDIFGEISGPKAEETFELPEAAREEESRSGGPSEAWDLATADAFVAGGNYYKALGAYKKLLEREPGNMRVLQRVVELKSLMQLLGKGDEVLIAQLEAFLDALKRGFSKKS
ncbi:MAG: hypothetical protein M1497_03915 [Nitrospirae bacterium]|nr:hypothetical protein [Nitrospirota bacterium]